MMYSNLVSLLLSLFGQVQLTLPAEALSDEGMSLDPSG